MRSLVGIVLLARTPTTIGGAARLRNPSRQSEAAAIAWLITTALSGAPATNRAEAACQQHASARMCPQLSTNAAVEMRPR